MLVNSPVRRMGTTSRTKQQAAARLQDGAGSDSAVLDGLPAVAIHAPSIHWIPPLPRRRGEHAEGRRGGATKQLQSDAQRQGCVLAWGLLDR